MNELIYPAAEKPGGVPGDMEIDGTLQWGEDTAIYGHLRQDLGDNCPQATRIALTAKDGSPLWDVTCSNGTTGYEEAVYAAEKDDRLTVISREDNYDRSDYDPVQTSMYLITMIYDKNGQEIFRNRSSIGDWGVWGGAPINGGHILHCEGILNTADVRFLQKLDDSGDPCGAFTYLSGKNTLYYSDMKEVNKKLYISGYYVPTPAESYGRPEIDGVLAAYEHTSGTDLTDHGPDEQLTRMVRDNYTAFLIQCDPADGDIDAMYTVDGALGAELDGSGDGITWNIEEVAGTYYSPATRKRHFCIYGGDGYDAGIPKITAPSVKKHTTAKAGRLHPAARRLFLSNYSVYSSSGTGASSSSGTEDAVSGPSVSAGTGDAVSGVSVCRGAGVSSGASVTNTCAVSCCRYMSLNCR